MSLVENDFLLGWLWDQPTMAVAALMVFAVWVLWAIKAIRANFDPEYPPYGLSIFKWLSNFVGDPIFLTGAATTIASYYSEVRVDPSPLTSIWFFVVCALISVAGALRFIVMENNDPQGYGQPDVKRFTADRAYHFGFYVLNVYIFLGFLRSFIYWEQVGLMALTILFYLGWAATIYLDGRWSGKQENPAWRFVTKKTGRAKYL